jgi:hypothetical protein
MDMELGMLPPGSGTKLAMEGLPEERNDPLVRLGHLRVFHLLGQAARKAGAMPVAGVIVPVDLGIDVPDG